MKPALLSVAALCLLALGCPERERAAAPADPSRPPDERAKETLEQAAPTPGAAEEARESASPDAGEGAPGGPARDAGAQGAGAAGPTREWTAGVLERQAPRELRPVTLRAVRAARNEGFDRVVFEFEGEALPGYHVEYVDRPVRQCGSGDEVPLAGEGWLSVRMVPAQAHTEAGQPTVPERELKPLLPVVLELERTCDFEGEVTWVLGNRGPNRYRVLELRSPTRLVVDVRH